MESKDQICKPCKTGSLHLRIDTVNNQEKYFLSCARLQYVFASDWPSLRCAQGSILPPAGEEEGWGWGGVGHGRAIVVGLHHASG